MIYPFKIIIAVILICALVFELCSCKGHKCPPLRDYQLDLHMDTVRIYDGDRLVGSYISNWGNQMDSIILKDNE